MNFLELLEANNFKAINESFGKKENILNNAAEYNNDRTIRDTQVGKREDKVTTKDVVKVTKIPIPFQRQIVKTAATFLFGSPVKFVEKKRSDTEGGSEDVNEAFNAILDLWDDLRMDSNMLKLCKAVKSETEASIVFFPVEVGGEGGEKKEVKIKSRLITSKNGNVYPIFDAFGDLVAFNWQYIVKENDKDVTYWYIWTAEKAYAMKAEGETFVNLEGYPKENMFGKIPAVYMSQEYPEWWEVQDLIDSFEMSFSKFVDTNAYFASPMYKAKGSVKSLPEKDETGKMVKLDIIETDKGNIIEADLDVISWDRAPESLKLEFETNKELIYGLTDTPDLSFNNVKGIGNVSGIALKLMFLGTILKSKEGEGDFKISISRIINVLKAGISNITNTGLKGKLLELKIDTVFTSVLPENTKEIIEQLTEASAGKAIMSQKTAISHNPLVDDIDEELENIADEAQADAASQLGGTEILE